LSLTTQSPCKKGGDHIRTIQAEAKIRAFEHRFRLNCSLIAAAMGQNGAGIWAERADLQPVHQQPPSGLMKNVHLLRYPSPASTTDLPVRLMPRGCGRLATGHFCSASGT
ncbi:hypothetical protein C2E25_14680, partial [Geothermobacter hydrogeniphilus]